MADIIQLRRDIASNWTSANPTLAQGELGIETDTLKFKIGDGTTVWTSLAYYSNTDVNAIHDNVSAEINAITEKTTAHNNDLLLIEDSQNSNVKRKLKISNLPSGSVPTKEIFYMAREYGSNEGNYRVRSVSSTASSRFTFKVPHDFNTLSSLVFVAIPEADISNGDVDLYSDYASVGEDAQIHTESDLLYTINATSNQITEFDISSVYTNLNANDYCGLQWDNNGIGTTLDVLGIRLKYS